MNHIDQHKPAEPSQTHSPIVELRHYTLHPEKRETLIELFENEFLEGQESVGIKVIGQFPNLMDANSFVWLRGFADMHSRQQALTEDPRSG